MSNSTKATDKILGVIDPSRAFLEKQEMRRKIMEAAGVTELFTFIACVVDNKNRRRFAIRIEDMPDPQTAHNVATHLFRTEKSLKQYFYENPKHPNNSDHIRVALAPNVNPKIAN